MYALETLDPCHWLCVVKPQRPWAPQWYLSSKPTNAETLKCGSYTRWHNLRAISTAGSLPTGTTAPLGILAGKCSLSGSCFEPWAQAALALEAPSRSRRLHRGGGQGSVGIRPRRNLRAISAAGALPTRITAPLGILAGKDMLSGADFESWAQAALALGFISFGETLM